MRVQDADLVVARVEGSLLAFRDACADCGAALGTGDLVEGVLTCPACERGYFLPRAGRSLDDERLLLAPVPLLAGAGREGVAVSAELERKAARRRSDVVSSIRRLSSSARERPAPTARPLRVRSAAICAGSRSRRTIGT